MFVKVGSIGCGDKVVGSYGWLISVNLTGGIVTIITIMLVMTSQVVYATQ